jgi:hypothetical protein
MHCWQVDMRLPFLQRLENEDRSMLGLSRLKSEPLYEFVVVVADAFSPRTRLSVTSSALALDSGSAGRCFPEGTT